MNHHYNLCTVTSCSFGLQKTPKVQSLCLQRSLSVTRIWCTMMSADVRKPNIPAPGIRRTLTVSHLRHCGVIRQLYDWDQSLYNKTEKHPSISCLCLFQKTRGVKGQVWCTRQMMVTDNRGISKNERYCSCILCSNVWWCEMTKQWSNIFNNPNYVYF